MIAPILLILPSHSSIQDSTSYIFTTSPKQPSAVTYGSLSGALILAGGLVAIAGDEICRKIDNIPDNHPVDEPISPSVYDSDLHYSIPNRNNIADDISKEEPINLT